MYTAESRIPSPNQEQFNYFQLRFSLRIVEIGVKDYNYCHNSTQSKIMHTFFVYSGFILGLDSLLRDIGPH